MDRDLVPMAFIHSDPSSVGLGCSRPETSFRFDADRICTDRAVRPQMPPGIALGIVRTRCIDKRRRCSNIGRRGARPIGLVPMRLNPCWAGTAPTGHDHHRPGEMLSLENQQYGDCHGTNATAARCVFGITMGRIALNRSHHW